MSDKDATLLQIVRYSIIVVIASSIGWIGIDTYFHLPEHGNEPEPGIKSTISGFGKIDLFNPKTVALFSVNTYHDTRTGFQISKPNDKWLIHSIRDDLSERDFESLISRGFIDGVYVEQEHDKRFMVTVFDVQSDDFLLRDYIDSQLYQIQLQKNINVPIKQISSENDWAIFAVDAMDENKYNEQLLFLKESRLYMLQYFGDAPDTLDSKQMSDYQFITDSFEVI